MSEKLEHIHIESSSLHRENATHQAYAQSRRPPTYVYAPSPQYYRILNDFCNLDTIHINEEIVAKKTDSVVPTPVLVIVGESASGKTALLANWAADRIRCNDNSQELLHEHYAGCSYDSVKLSLFLYRFMHQIIRTFGLRDFELPHEDDEEKLKFSFSRCLEAAMEKVCHHSKLTTKRRQIVLVLDGIDNIRSIDGGDSLSWLPIRFPQGVKIIVSTNQFASSTCQNNAFGAQFVCCKQIRRKPCEYDSDGDLIYSTTLQQSESDTSIICEFRRRNAAFVVVEPLDETTCRAIFSQYLAVPGRENFINHNMIDQIVDANGSSNPRYIRLIINGLELFDSKYFADGGNSDLKDRSSARQSWLNQATPSVELVTVYEHLISRWNDILLADLIESESLLRKHEAFVHKNGSASDQNSDDLTNISGSPRKTSELLSSTTESSKKKSRDLKIAKSSSILDSWTSIEQVKIAIEQRALLVRHSLSLLSVSRHGLSAHDLFNLFGDFVTRQTGMELISLLMPHLMEIRYDSSSTEIYFHLSHNQLHMLIRHGFLREPARQKAYYKEVAMYFEKMDPCQRRIDELPVQLERCNMWSTLQATLVDMKMFSLWWHEKNRQEYAQYWKALKAISWPHDLVDDFIKSLDDHMLRENLSLDQLLELLLMITEFLRAWQSYDSEINKSQVQLNRPTGPRLCTFIGTLAQSCPSVNAILYSSVDTVMSNENFMESSVDYELKMIRSEIQNLSAINSKDQIKSVCDGYYVQRWLWSQFPLIALAFESRILKQLNVGKAIENSASSSKTAHFGVPNLLDKITNKNSSFATEAHSCSVPKPNEMAPTKNSGEKLPLFIVKSETNELAFSGPKSHSQKSLGSPFSNGEPDNFGAFQFLSEDQSVYGVKQGSDSVSEMEINVMKLRTKYNKLKFALTEKLNGLKQTESRILDAKASAQTSGNCKNRMIDIQDRISNTNAEIAFGRQQMEYYKAILRHCELHPAKDPTIIEVTEAQATKIKRDINDIQHKTHDLIYETRLASNEVPKLLEVLEEKKKMHQVALARLQWRKELVERSRNIKVTGVSTPQPTDTDSVKFPDVESIDDFEINNCGEDTDDYLNNTGTTTNHVNIVHNLEITQVKDKLLRKREANVERSKRSEALKVYVGSTYKDDGLLGVLRAVGINKLEDAHMYIQDQMDHAKKLEVEEKECELNVFGLQQKLNNMQTQLQNLKIGGVCTCNENQSESQLDTDLGYQSPISVQQNASKGQNLKILDQQLAQATATCQEKKIRALRNKSLSEKVYLGLTHIADIVEIHKSQQKNMTLLELVDAVEKVVRTTLGDSDLHPQLRSGISISNMNVRRGASLRKTSIVAKFPLSTIEVPSNQLSNMPVLNEPRTIEDKIRYNIRINKDDPMAQLNPYIDSDQDNKDEDSDDDNDEINNVNSQSSTNNKNGNEINQEQICDVPKRESMKKKSKEAALRAENRKA